MFHIKQIFASIIIASYGGHDFLLNKIAFASNIIRISFFIK